MDCFVCLHNSGVSALTWTRIYIILAIYEMNVVNLDGSLSGLDIDLSNEFSNLPQNMLATKTINILAKTL